MQRCRLYRIHKVLARTDGQNHGTTAALRGIIKNWLLKSDEEAYNAGQISDPYVRGSVTIGQTDTHTQTDAGQSDPYVTFDLQNQ